MKDIGGEDHTKLNNKNVPTGVSSNQSVPQTNGMVVSRPNQYREVQRWLDLVAENPKYKKKKIPRKATATF